MLAALLEWTLSTVLSIANQPKLLFNEGKN
jgi:hypothetical protein